jgi:uncharacterized phage protein gp47/JayE
MAYFQPFISDAGYQFPSYQDIEDYLVGKAQQIFGADIYLENDSQDFQMIAALAQSQYDSFLSAQLAYNSRSVSNAIGVPLDELVANNGITRFPATKSLVTLTLTGTAFTVINNGVASDTSGNVWILPTSVTIGSTGTVSVTATAQQFGPINAAPGTVTQIQTPTAGWVSVTNPNAAGVGQDIETDGALKSRQAIATAGPTQTVLGGIVSAIRDLPGVTAAQIYENQTNAPLTTINGATNSGGFPEKSLTLVVTGGDDNQIAAAYGVRKTPGVLSNGTTHVNYVDTAGVTTSIGFYRPTLNPLDFTVTIKALPGYSDTVRETARKAISDYVNALPAGSTIVISEIWQVIANSDTNNTMSIKLVTVGNHNGSQFNNDAPLAFNRKPTSSTADITWVIP